MKYVKLILRNVNVLNILLLITAILLFFVFDYPLLNRQISVEQIEAKEVAIQNEGKITPENSASYADFVTVAEKNLFHPEREMPKAEKAAVPKPELILYGTLITDDVSVAYVEDKKSPYSTPGRAKRQTALKKGSSIAGYVLREIEPDRIVLVRGDDKLVVKLEDETDKRKGSETGTSQPSKGSPGPLMPAAVVPGAAPAIALPPATTPSKPVAPSTSAPPRAGQSAEMMLRNPRLQQQQQRQQAP